MNMGRPPGVVMVAPGIRAGFHCYETPVAFAIGLRAAGAGKIRIERRGMLVADVDIAAAGIGLPDFEQRIRHAAAVFIQYMTVYDDALAERLAFVLDGKIVVVLAHRLQTQR